MASSQSNPATKRWPVASRSASGVMRARPPARCRSRPRRRRRIARARGAGSLNGRKSIKINSNRPRARSRKSAARAACAVSLIWIAPAGAVSAGAPGVRTASPNTSQPVWSSPGRGRRPPTAGPWSSPMRKSSPTPASVKTSLSRSCSASARSARRRVAASPSPAKPSANSTRSPSACSQATPSAPRRRPRWRGCAGTGCRHRPCARPRSPCRRSAPAPARQGGGTARSRPSCRPTARAGAPAAPGRGRGRMRRARRGRLRRRTGRARGDRQRPAGQQCRRRAGKGAGLGDAGTGVLDPGRAQGRCCPGGRESARDRHREQPPAADRAQTEARELGGARVGGGIGDVQLGGALDRGEQAPHLGPAQPDAAGGGAGGEVDLAVAVQCRAAVLQPPETDVPGRQRAADHAQDCSGAVGAGQAPP